MYPYTHPQIIGHTPGNLETDVALDSQIRIEFSGDINPDSIHINTFMVIQGGQPVLGDYEYNAKTKEAIFKPKENLKPGRKYQVILVGDQNSKDFTKTILNVLDNPLENNYTFSFTTTEETELDPPEIISPIHQSITDNLYFEWTEVEEAISYEIQISDHKLFETVVYHNIVYSTSLEVNDLELDKEYFVRIRAIADKKTSDWSKLHSFYYEISDLTDFAPKIPEEQIEVKLLYPQTILNVDTRLTEIIFEVNQEVEEEDIEVILEGVSVNGMPHIRSDGIKQGTIEILEKKPNYTKIRYVI